MTPVDIDEVIALKQRIAKLERTVEFLLQQLKLDYVDKPNYGENAAYIDLIRQNKLMDAIKLYREKTGAGLAEAKMAIESLAGSL